MSFVACLRPPPSDLESRQRWRAEVIVAPVKAIEITSSGAVAANADTHLPALSQDKSASLEQLRNVARSPAQQHVVEYLQNRPLH